MLFVDTEMTTIDSSKAILVPTVPGDRDSSQICNRQWLVCQQSSPSLLVNLIFKFTWRFGELLPIKGQSFSALLCNSAALPLLIGLPLRAAVADLTNKAGRELSRHQWQWDFN